MSLFHHHDRHGADDREAPASFEVLGDDRVIRRYPRDDFDMIVETTDPDEVRREVERGWVVLDERDVPKDGRERSGDDLIVGIEGLHVGGLVGPEQSEMVTQYTIGILREGATGEPEA